MGFLLLFFGVLIYLLGMYALDRIPGSDLVALYIADAITFGGMVVIMFGALFIIIHPSSFSSKRACLTHIARLLMLLTLSTMGLLAFSQSVFAYVPSASHRFHLPPSQAWKTTSPTTPSATSSLTG